MLKRKRTLLTVLLLVAVATVVVPFRHEVWDALTLTPREVTTSAGLKYAGSMRWWNAAGTYQFVGMYRVYYRNGALKEERDYREGDESGVWRAWDSSGSLSGAMRYSDGREYCGVTEVEHAEIWSTNKFRQARWSGGRMVEERQRRPWFDAATIEAALNE